jgi:hypothetical protein
MVTNSTAWQEIAKELHLDCKANRSKGSPTKRVGAEIGLEYMATAKGDATASQVIRSETIRLLERYLDPEAAEATIDKLERKLMTDEEARKMVEELTPDGRKFVLDNSKP